MKDLHYDLYDLVELKKEHPCSKRTKLFQIIRLGADLKIQCQGCGNVILISRDTFNMRFKKVISHHSEILFKKEN